MACPEISQHRVRQVECDGSAGDASGQKVAGRVEPCRVLLIGLLLFQKEVRR